MPRDDEQQNAGPKPGGEPQGGRPRGAAGMIGGAFSWLFGAGEDADSGLWGTVKTVIYAVLIAVVVRTVVIEPFNIPSGSMKPTLLVGDFLFVTKYSYGYSRHSLPFSPALFSGRIMGREPKRGDVAVFKLPSDNQTDYIKRIIGLPGDRVQVKGGILHLNGEPVTRRRVGEFAEYPRARRIPRYVEVLPGGRTHAIIEESDDNGLADETRVFVVPPGHYFMMGDNRDNSQDSRFPRVGFVPFENLVGRADFLFFSVDEDATRWWEVWNWPGAIRYDRVFKSIE